MENGWNYLEHFNTGVLEATGKKATLKHVLVTMEHDPAKNTLHCFINGMVEPEMVRDLPLQSEFMVRIKCADKDEGLYLTAKGRACVKEIGHDADGLRAAFDVKITGIAAYRKETDENGIDYLKPLHNNLTVREERRSKKITDYKH